MQIASRVAGGCFCLFYTASMGCTYVLDKHKPRTLTDQELVELEEMRERVEERDAADREIIAARASEQMSVGDWVKVAAAVWIGVKAAKAVIDEPEATAPVPVSEPNEPLPPEPVSESNGMPYCESSDSAEKSCLCGSPVLSRPTNPLVVIDRSGYSLGHHSDLKVSLWVCQQVLASDLTGPAKRDESEFLPDPKLAKGNRAEVEDYHASGFDRGHLAPAADFKHSQSETDESFYLSNIVPQVGEGFNRGIWEELEARAREVAADNARIWVITGPVFGSSTNEVLGANKVAVPTSLYKIIIRQSGGSFQSASFLMSNQSHEGSHLEEFAVSIDEIEKRTGIDFLHDLPDEVEATLESQSSVNWFLQLLAVSSLSENVSMSVGAITQF